MTQQCSIRGVKTHRSSETKMTKQEANENVDSNEIKKFDAMAEKWWDPQGDCKPLHDLNPLRLDFIQTCCPLADRMILDVGCGAGILTESLSRFSAFVTGIDQSEKALDIAREHARTLPHPPDYQFTTAEQFAASYPERFDVITCMELLEHVPSPTALLEACSTLLKPGGHLIVSTINRTPKAFCHAIIGAEYLLGMLPKGTHQYDRFIRPSELFQWANSNHLALKKMSGFSYRILGKSFFLSDDVSVNYVAHFQKGSE